MKNNFFIKTEGRILKKQKNIEKPIKTKKINNFSFSPKKQNKSISLKILEQTNDKELKIRLNKAKKKISRNLLQNRNINDYYQFITDYTNPNKGNLSWAINLRESNKKKIIASPIKVSSTENNEKNYSHEKIKGLRLTTNFKEPKFYFDDLEKYKLKLKKNKRPLSSILNPNFNNIRHLYINKNGQSKEFSSTLRNYNINTKKSLKDNIRWNDYFTGNKENKFLVRFMPPRTKSGKKNLQKLEKRIYSPYSLNYRDVIFLNEKIRQKFMTPKKDYTYGGIGEHLNMINYHTKYPIKNSSQAENILKNETNSQCLFELGLRNYNILSNKKIK